MVQKFQSRYFIKNHNYVHTEARPRLAQPGVSTDIADTASRSDVAETPTLPPHLRSQGLGRGQESLSSHGLQALAPPIPGGPAPCVLSGQSCWALPRKVHAQAMPTDTPGPHWGPQAPPPSTESLCSLGGYQMVSSIHSRERTSQDAPQTPSAPSGLQEGSPEFRDGVLTAVVGLGPRLLFQKFFCLLQGGEVLEPFQVSTQQDTQHGDLQAQED